MLSRTWTQRATAVVLLAAASNGCSDDPLEPTLEQFVQEAGELLVGSDWSAGDWSDGGKWGNQSVWAERRVNVVAGEAGEPWAQKIRLVVGLEAFDSWIQMTLDGGPAPALGQPVTIRWYERIFEHSPSDPGHHPYALGYTNGDQPWFTLNTVPGGYFPGVQIIDDFDQPYWPRQPLPLGQWYRFEWTILQETANQARVTMSVYDLQGNRVLSPGDFVDWQWGDGNTSLNERVFQRDMRPLQTAFTGFLDGADGTNVLWGEFAAVAIVLGESAGPYDPARGW